MCLKWNTNYGRSARDVLSHVDESVDVVVIPLHVLVFDQPLQLLLNHFFRGQEHVFQDVD